MNFPTATLSVGLAVQTLLVLGVVFGLYGAVRGLYVFQKQRSVTNVPAVKMSNARLGPVQVSGLADGPHTLTAPISGEACFAYRISIWQERQKGKRQAWELVLEEGSETPFFLDDGSGSLLVDPAGAEMDLPRVFQREFHDDAFGIEAASAANLRRVLKRCKLDGKGKIRVEECYIGREASIFARGTVAVNPGTEVVPKGQAGERHPRRGMLDELLSVPAADDPEEYATQVVNPSANIAPPESATTMTQQGKIAAALQRAQREHPNKWTAFDPPPMHTLLEAALAHNAEEASALERTDTELEPAIAKQESRFDLHPAQVLRKGPRGMLISWRNRGGTSSSMSWSTVLLLWGGAGLTLLCLGALALQWGWL